MLSPIAAEGPDSFSMLCLGNRWTELTSWKTHLLFPLARPGQAAGAVPLYSQEGQGQRQTAG